MRLRSALTKTALVLPIGAGLLFGPLLPMASTAHAGIFSDFYQGAKELSELPGEVNELKANYEMTLDKLSEAESTLESYREQNEALMEQNRELAASVTALTEAQQKREANARKTRILILTGIALLAGYFLLLRVIRLLLRR
ncbi:hypothetical protein LBW89_06185 [Paenibacillus sp. alder61]|uniref:Uncharacterized protein n=1 Tax=Paenibacillus faecis TaxID=862114 RepID=A0A5D0CNZ6_9BACL|nr:MULTISPECIES: hypothetical protein [Paenibacillus]MCA1292602.1 hypothetical protein [Paenibacillus sp. alder61]TYA11646.1 hypothetical protein FRY98_21235 [Paenibacillus faecis]